MWVSAANQTGNAFKAGVPSANVIRLPNPNHYILRSDQAEVFRAMNDFLDKLPHPGR